MSVILLLFSFKVSSQENSTYFLEILNSKEYLKEKKEAILDSLFSNIHYKNFYDIHEYSRWLNKNGDSEKAISINKRVINNKELQKPKNKEIRSRMLKNLGYFNYLIKEYYESLYYYHQATLFKGFEDTSAKSHKKMGQIFFNLGDYYSAEKQYDKALFFSKNTDLNFHFGTLINASINQKEIKNGDSFIKGVLMLNEATSLINKNKNVTTKKRILEVYKHLGNIYCEYLHLNPSENFKKSLKNYSISLKIAEKLNDSSKTSLILNNIGYLHLLANKDNSINYFKKSLAYSKTRLNSSRVYSNISAYYQQKEQFDISLDNINKAINILVENPQKEISEKLNKQALKTNTHKFYLLNKLIDKGIILNKLNNFPKALETFKTCDYLLDLVRFESNNNNSKLFWQEKAALLFTEATKACNFLDDTSSALYFIEKNKAILLIENIEKPKYNPKDEIDFEIFKDLKMSEYKLEDFSNESKIITLSALQTQLPSNTILLNYIKNRDLGYVLMISKENNSIHEICEIEQLNDQITSYLKLISKPISKKEDLNLLNNLSTQIFEKIIPKNFDTISNNKKKLLIIPDSNLQHIPFESLTNKTQELIKRFEIGYAYSYTYLVKNNLVERNPTKQLISFAPHSFEYDNLKTLNHSLSESKQLSKTFDGKTFEKDSATTSNFINTIYDYNIINISSHADANDSIAPWIAFKDEKLFLDDIYKTKNQADLVVLSACNTSLGEIKQGEGVFSLARGFFKSGSNSVVSSLWSVNDKSNSIITTSFYNYLKKGKTKSAALRQAKLDYLNTHNLSQASPYYWSSMVLIGDDTAIKTDNTNWLYYLLGVLILGLFFFILRKNKISG